MNQMDNLQAISRRHLLNSKEVQLTNEINILTTQYNKIDIKKKDHKVNLYDNEREINIKYHNNDQLLGGKMEYKQNYNAGDRSPIKPLIRKEYQINDDNTKRHSLDTQTLTSLRRDSEQSLQNRQSLKLNHISKTDDTAIKKSLNKAVISYDKLVSEKQIQTLSSLNYSNNDKYLSPRLEANGERKELQNAKFQSNLPQFEQYIYHNSTFVEPSSNHKNKHNKYSLVGISDQQSDMQKNCTVRRYRSISFPNQSKNKQRYNNAQDGKEYSTGISFLFHFYKIIKHLSNRVIIAIIFFYCY